MAYGRFAAMIFTSTVVMFGLMYLNTYLWTHVFFSETRLYMALVMGATMAVIMLGFMLSMYSNKTLNAAIFAGALLAFGVSLWLVRSQVTVGDTSFMRAMIPHHSIAIMTSSRANISDPRVRKLADEIIFAQDKEIAEMRYLIDSIDDSGDGAESGASEPKEVGTLADALSSAEVAVLDPEFMTPDEVARLFPDGAACFFTYTEDSPPVLAVGENGAGLVKLSGDLVRVDAGNAAGSANGLTLAAIGIAMRISPPLGEAALDPMAGRQEVDLLLELDAGLRVGYRGFYGCRG
ncbi:MAG: DUF305 domain-containing protein [Sneathiellaceae bacterium]